MSRESKPGDVAMVECSDGEWRKAICGTRFIDDSLVWVFANNGLRDADGSTVRPLVVIDPEDREQVERLWRLDAAEYDSKRDPQPEEIGNLQAALREFANPTPPKPAEPTGLGAVVEDADGGRWVQVGRRGDWYQAHGKWAQYGSIDVVRVLSEGVTL